MKRDELAKRLLASFVEELAGHVASLERDLLALEQLERQEERVTAGARPEAREPTGGRSELLHALFRTTHTIKGASRAAGVSLVEEATHRLEDVLSQLREGSLEADADIFALLFGVTDALGDAGERLARGESLEQSSLARFIGRFDAKAAPDATARAQPRDAALRVTADRIDGLLGTAIEIGVAFRRLTELDHTLAELRAIAANGGDGHRIGAALDRFTTTFEADRRRLAVQVSGLDRALKQLRMVPFADACRGLDRTVRDVARGSGKEVELVVEGEDVELDRDVVLGLRDPLLQLVRNAVDHGIEAPRVRSAMGKSERGNVRVSALLRGAEVVITVRDDGRGLDLAAIRANLQRRDERVPVRNEDIVRSIFTAGFSTAPIVTDVSGRGVGLDIVKRAVDDLLGVIELDFQEGHGTSFTLRVPVTRSSMRALLVRTGRRTWVLPGIAVKRLLRVSADQIHLVFGVDTVSVDGTPVPVISLAATLGEDATQELRDAKAALVVVTSQGTDLALVVDELCEEREVVVKPLGPRLSASEWISGATVLPSGRLAYILNVAAIVAHARGAAHGAPVFEPAGVVRQAKTVLLVDDSPTTRILERSILEAAGFVVVLATDGAEAWRLLGERSVDLVVSDVEMPNMDGFALTEAIRTSVRLRELPVVLVTALASEADRARGLDVGASAYLVKSAFDQKNLIETIAQLL